MLLHHRPTKTVITGKSGSGKTTYFQRLIENGFASYWPTVLIYDWQGEMSLRLNRPSVIRSEDFPAELRNGILIYDPNIEFEGNLETGLNFFAKWCFETCKCEDAPPYPRLFCCDEIQLLLDNDNMPPEIQTILQTGRRWGLDMAIVSQQINELHNRFRSQSTERVTFQHEDTYVLSVMNKWGFDPEQVKVLDVGQYLYNNDRGETGSGKLFGVDKGQQKPEVEGVRQHCQAGGSGPKNPPTGNADAKPDNDNAPDEQS